MTAGQQDERVQEPVNEAAWAGTLIGLTAGALLLSLAGAPSVLAGIGSAMGVVGIMAAAALFTRAARGGTDSRKLPALVGLALLAFVARSVTVWI